MRQQKKLVPTEKGLALHSVVKNMAIANVEMTGKWEAELNIILFAEFLYKFGIGK